MREPVRLEWRVPAHAGLDLAWGIVVTLTAAVMAAWAFAHVRAAADFGDVPAGPLAHAAVALACASFAAGASRWRWLAGHRFGAARWLRLEGQRWHWGHDEPLAGLRASSPVGARSPRQGQARVALVLGHGVLIKARDVSGTTDWMWVDTRSLGASGGSLRTALNWA